MTFLLLSQADDSLSGVQCFVLKVNSQKYLDYNSCLNGEVSLPYCISVNLMTVFRTL